MDTNPQQQPTPQPPKKELKKTRCHYCGHRHAVRPYHKFEVEDTMWRCEFCKKVLR